MRTENDENRLDPRWEMFLILCFRRRLQNITPTIDGREVTLHEIVRKDGFLPGLLAHAIEFWSIPVHGMNGLGGFNVGFESNNDALLKVRVTNIQYSKPTFFLVPVLMSFFSLIDNDSCRLEPLLKSMANLREIALGTGSPINATPFDTTSAHS
ncbi:hypothetical protein ACQU0X_26910 [Pseudovibrio ascidiaceicola]|uniref:hypothetical protein n=1 Tax=Pseudovibrio ascidiaceicola TaxID=285279 RepID=UPI003D35DDDE